MALITSPATVARQLPGNCPARWPARGAHRIRSCHFEGLSMPDTIPIQPTAIRPIIPTGYSGNAGPAMQPFSRDTGKNWYETARQEMSDPGASPADKPKWIKPNPPLTPGMSLADLKALALKNDWEAMAFKRPGPPAILTVIRFQKNGDPLISTDGKQFAVLDEVHHLPSIWQHHADIYCRRITEKDSWDEEARRRHVGLHIGALREQIAILDQDRAEYAKAWSREPDLASLKAAADACTMLRGRLEAKLAELLSEQAADLAEPRVLPRRRDGEGQPVPGSSSASASPPDANYAGLADDRVGDHVHDPFNTRDESVADANRDARAVPMKERRGR
jgi:hypothetical protein